MHTCMPYSHSCFGWVRRMCSGQIVSWLCSSQVHGFPKVMGVLTHLDGFKDNKRLKKTKKTLKHRFWAEIYQGVPLSTPAATPVTNINSARLCAAHASLQPSAAPPSSTVKSCAHWASMPCMLQRLTIADLRAL